MPSLAIEAANSTVHEIFTNGTIDEDSPTPEDSLATISKKISIRVSVLFNL